MADMCTLPNFGTCFSMQVYCGQCVNIFKCQNYVHNLWHNDLGVSPKHSPTQPNNIYLILAKIILYTICFFYLFWLMTSFENFFYPESQQAVIKLILWPTKHWKCKIFGQSELNYCQLNSIMCTLKNSYE